MTESPIEGVRPQYVLPFVLFPPIQKLRTYEYVRICFSKRSLTVDDAHTARSATR